MAPLHPVLDLTCNGHTVHVLAHHRAAWLLRRAGADAPFSLAAGAVRLALAAFQLPERLAHHSVRVELGGPYVRGTIANNTYPASLWMSMLTGSGLSAASTAGSLAEALERAVATVLRVAFPRLPPPSERPSTGALALTAFGPDAFHAEADGEALVEALAERIAYRVLHAAVGDDVTTTVVAELHALGHTLQPLDGDGDLEWFSGAVASGTLGITLGPAGPVTVEWDHDGDEHHAKADVFPLTVAG